MTVVLVVYSGHGENKEVLLFCLCLDVMSLMLSANDHIMIIIIFINKNCLSIWLVVVTCTARSLLHIIIETIFYPVLIFVSAV